MLLWYMNITWSTEFFFFFFFLSIFYLHYCFVILLVYVMKNNEFGKNLTFDWRMPNTQQSGSPSLLERRSDSCYRCGNCKLRMLLTNMKHNDYYSLWLAIRYSSWISSYRWLLTCRLRRETLFCGTILLIALREGINWRMSYNAQGTVHICLACFTCYVVVMIGRN